MTFAWAVLVACVWIWPREKRSDVMETFAGAGSFFIRLVLTLILTVLYLGYVVWVRS